MTIYVIGNSHAMMFSEAHPSETFAQNKWFKSYRLGACTAWAFKKHIEKVKELVPFGEKLIIPIGEVDIRAHLFKQAALQNRSYESVLFECMERYFDVIFELRNEYQIICWSPHPTANTEDNNPLSPVIGPVEIRNYMTKLWDLRLDIVCRSEKIPFTSIVNHLIDENYRTRSEFFADYTHLNHKAYSLMINQFKKQGLII